MKPKNLTDIKVNKRHGLVLANGEFSKKTFALGNLTATKNGIVPPFRMPFSKNISIIVAGGQSSLAVNSTGHVFTLGLNDVLIYSLKLSGWPTWRWYFHRPGRNNFTSKY
jgi:hypothetical protein